jgi:methyl-accepting chemotaxis protein-1 (serine sensor receptor)
MTVRARLAATFGFLAAMVLLVALLGLSALSSTDHGFGTFVNGVNARSWLAEKIRFAAEQRLNLINELAMATTPGAIADARAKLAATDKGLLDALRQLGTMTASAPDATARSRTLFAAIARAEQAYDSVAPARPATSATMPSRCWTGVDGRR